MNNPANSIRYLDRRTVQSDIVLSEFLVGDTVLVPFGRGRKIESHGGLTTVNVISAGVKTACEIATETARNLPVERRTLGHNSTQEFAPEKIEGERAGQIMEDIKIKRGRLPKSPFRETDGIEEALSIASMITAKKVINAKSADEKHSALLNLIKLPDLWDRVRKIIGV